MTPLAGHQIAAFLKRFRFRGGRLLRLRVRRVAGRDPQIELVVFVRQGITDLGARNPPVRLRLRLSDVREFSMRKRPADDRLLLRKTDMDYLGGQFFLNFDSYLDEGERAEIHDYRASDLYFACSLVEWEILPERPGKG